MAKLFVEQRRGHGSTAVVEAVHGVDALLCDVDGKVQLLSGSDCITTLRSAGKPFQLEVSLSLLPEQLRKQLSSHELALGAASHHGERFHVSALAQLLARLGLSEHDLLCGAHAPVHAASAQALYARGEQPSAIHNNCAGKHAFMAAACRAHGFPVDYRPASHPLQRAFLARIGECGGELALTVVDGCGVPCPALRLSAIARAYALLACELRDGSGSTLATVGRAMRAHPLLVSGSEAFDGWLMQHTGVLAKVGALGLLCIAIPQRGLGLAIKVQSGSDLARPAAAALLLERALPGCLREELPSRFRVVRNVAGAEVGAIVTRLEAD